MHDKLQFAVHWRNRLIRGHEVTLVKILFSALVGLNLKIADNIIQIFNVPRLLAIWIICKVLGSIYSLNKTITVHFIYEIGPYNSIYCLRTLIIELYIVADIQYIAICIYSCNSNSITNLKSGEKTGIDGLCGGNSICSKGSCGNMNIESILFPNSALLLCAIK